MKASKLLIGLFCIFLLPLLTAPRDGYPGIYSWVDNQGVRHFSNATVQDKKASVDASPEYETTEQDDRLSEEKERSKMLQAIEERRQRRMEEKEREFEQRYKREAEKHRKAEERVIDTRKQQFAEGCEHAKQKLKELERTGWKNYNTRDIINYEQYYNDYVNSHRTPVYQAGRVAYVRTNRPDTVSVDTYRRSAYEKEKQRLKSQIKTYCAGAFTSEQERKLREDIKKRYK